LLLLLDDRLQTATAQFDAAHAATDWSQADAMGVPGDEYEFDDSEPDV
jgi:hypothetical protein